MVAPLVRTCARPGLSLEQREDLNLPINAGLRPAKYIPKPGRIILVSYCNDLSAVMSDGVLLSIMDLSLEDLNQGGKWRLPRTYVRLGV